MTGTDGYFTASYRYNAYGEMTFGKPQYENVYGYNGESYNPNLDGQYLRARHYHVEAANFFTEDSYLGIWIAEDGKVDQIGVEKDFRGKYENIIGIGSTMSDVKKYFGEYVDIYGTFEIKNIDGMCFELEDVKDYDDEWGELTAPIEFIFVYRGHQQ